MKGVYVVARAMGLLHLQTVYHEASVYFVVAPPMGLLDLTFGH